MFSPVKTEQPDIALDRVDIFLLFLGRICVIEPQMAASAELSGDAEIQADRLGMTDVEIAIWLRRKAGNDLFDATGVKIALDDVTNKIAARFGRTRVASCLCIGSHASSNVT